MVKTRLRAGSDNRHESPRSQALAFLQADFLTLPGSFHHARREKYFVSTFGALKAAVAAAG
jgi:hypothetical protein